MTPKTSVKTVDSKGRLVLGAEFANSTVIVNRVHATEIVVTKARAVPEHELWLLEHPKALASVLEGLHQAATGEFVQGPPDFEANLAADLEVARKADKPRRRKPKS
jgi:hypothetical protein